MSDFAGKEQDPEKTKLRAIAAAKTRCDGVNLQNYFYIVLFSLLPVILLSQDKSKVNSATQRIGVKFIVEESKNGLVDPEAMFVYNGGMQAIRKLDNSAFSVESGFFLITRAVVDRSFVILYRNLSVPLNIRFDTKYIYISGGPIFEYLVKEDISDWRDQSRGFNPRKFNIGLNGNLGITFFPKKSLHAFFEIRRSGHFTSFQKREKSLQWGNFKNAGFAIGVNYPFHVSQKKLKID